jgi:hypothetical protein
MSGLYGLGCDFGPSGLVNVPALPLLAGASELIQAAIFKASALGTCGMGGISVA